MISEIHNMDCMDLIRQYPDKHFDLAVVDPPYGIGENGARGNVATKKWKNPKQSIHIKKEWDKNRPDRIYFEELFRVSKNQIIWGANYYPEFLPASMGWIFWDKKTGDSDYSDGELAFTSFEKALKKFEYLWSGFKKQKPETRIHPTQKPVALYDWIFKNYAKEGQLILDTHLGSGSSRIAADRAGLNFVGCELDADYFAAHEKRWNEYKLQIKLL